jgi:uncharacterized protein (DUF2141 family)
MARMAATLVFSGLLLVSPPYVAPTPDGPRNEVVFRVAIEIKRGGDVLCALYRNEDNWLTRTRFRATGDDADERTAVCRFRDVPKGIYAIASLHDEDGDGRMDKNFLGLPLEGYATSRDAHLRTILKPSWDDAVFTHKGRITIQTARMKY